MESYLMMAHQTVQKFLNKNKKRPFTSNEACMHASLCDIIAEDARLRILILKKQRMDLEQELDKYERTSGENTSKIQ